MASHQKLYDNQGWLGCGSGAMLEEGHPASPGRKWTKHEAEPSLRKSYKHNYNRDWLGGSSPTSSPVREKKKLPPCIATGMKGSIKNNPFLMNDHS